MVLDPSAASPRPQSVELAWYSGSSISARLPPWRVVTVRAFGLRVSALVAAALIAACSSSTAGGVGSAGGASGAVTAQAGGGQGGINAGDGAGAGGGGGTGPAGGNLGASGSVGVAGAPPVPVQLVAEIGGGKDAFVPLADGDSVPVIMGVQGGYHIWTAVRIHDPTLKVVAVSLTSRFEDTGALVGQPSKEAAVFVPQ